MSKIYDAQDRLGALLASDAFFSDFGDPQNPVPIIPVLSQRKGDIANEIAQTLNNIGIGVLVMLPRITSEGVDQRIHLVLSFVVAVSENPTINQTGKPAEAVMEKVFQIVNWQPSLNGSSANPLWRPGRFVIDNPAATLLGGTRDMPSLVNYLLRFKTTIALP